MNAQYFCRIFILAASSLLFDGPLIYAAQTDLSGPAGSVTFGKSVTVLSNGNFVVTDPNYSIPGGAVNVGAVYLYDGRTMAMISMLTGSTANDQVGLNGVTVLANGNYVVRSLSWDSGSVIDAGAATWGSGTAGVSGAVSAANSLVGGSNYDQIGSGGVMALPNGNYLVISPYSYNGTSLRAGSVTWGSGTAGVKGAVTAANSLVGSTANDQIGASGTGGVGGVIALSNGSYVVFCPNWDNGSFVDAGAATWGSGTAGVTGAVSAANSLVGSKASDQVGRYAIALANGNYVVFSRFWDNGSVTDAGAATWGSGTAGVTGAVSADNSLVGSTANDQVSRSGVMALANGNYVVLSPYWDNGAVVNAGAATWGSGTAGMFGEVFDDNSLIGSTAGDQVGYSATALANGNYVVTSPYWDNSGVTDAGAATWCGGTAAFAGAVSSANSLVGSTASDLVGAGGTIALANGHYVVRSYMWDNGGTVDAGAVTWGNGTAGVKGAVFETNSLVGGTASDQVGYGGTTGVVALANGNYVVLSRNWNNGATAYAGAATWGSGTAGVTGAVSAANSLVGSTYGDQVGYGVTVLANGSYVITSPSWDNGGVADTGASTWGSGTAGVKGTVSAANSLVGYTASDQVGYGGATALVNGHYVVVSPYWRNGTMAQAGAVTWGSGTAGVSGGASIANSLVGSTAGDMVGFGGVTALASGHYAVKSIYWDNGLAGAAGAVTLGAGASGTTGVVSPANSVLGDLASGGSTMTFADDPMNNRLVVGYPTGNRVSLFGYSVVSTVEITVRSVHGTADPAPGTHRYAEGTVLTNTVTSPDTQGATQFVCTGWSMAGNEPVSGAGLSCVMTATNDATLTWLWRTNYWLATSAGPHGSVNVGSGWQALGVTTQLTATAELYYHFTNWTGDAVGPANPLDLLMDRPKAVTANFTADMTANHPTPHWWLAQYGLTNDFEQASLADTDGDGHYAWQEFVADSVPTNRESVLRSMISVSNGVPKITWAPDTGAARVYTVEGRTNLTTDVWGPTNSASTFFRMKVRMP